MKGQPYLVTLTYRDGSTLTGHYHNRKKADRSAWAITSMVAHGITRATVTDTRTGTVLATYPKTNPAG